jgi:hypothetical protein
MKQLSETLRALSSSVRCAYSFFLLCLLAYAWRADAIVPMLLSFLLDVDASAQELISELIYASTATLDGRRFAFAAEFAQRH